MIFVAGNRTTFYGSTGIFLNGFTSTPCFAKILMKNTIQIHNIYPLGDTNQIIHKERR